MDMTIDAVQQCEIALQAYNSRGFMTAFTVVVTIIIYSMLLYAIHETWGVFKGHD